MGESVNVLLFILIGVQIVVLKEKNNILTKYFWNRPNMLKFSKFMSTENVKLTNLLVKYVHKAFTKEIENIYDRKTILM